MTGRLSAHAGPRFTSVPACNQMLDAAPLGVCSPEIMTLVSFGTLLMVRSMNHNSCRTIDEQGCLRCVGHASCMVHISFHVKNMRLQGRRVSD